MESHSVEVKKNKTTFTQKVVFKLLSQIKFGQLIIGDVSGQHTFRGIAGVDTHTVQIQVHDLNAYKRLLFNGTLAAGETYMQGSWDVDDLSKLVEIILKNTEVFGKIDGLLPKFINILTNLSALLKKNNVKRVKENILAHYDLGNEFFTQFLDSSMMYSCALYEPENISLEEASKNKIASICKRLALKPTDHIIEIGCGWGGFACYAAQHYGCKVTTTTISDKQYDYVKKQIEYLGLQDKITLLNCDYRKLRGQYDKLVSIEMIEAIGHQYFDTFFKQCNALVKPNGLMFLQAILINDQAYPRAKNEIDFIRKYIFPGGCLPSMSAISNSVSKNTQFQLISFQDIGKHYSKTLIAWLNNFNKNADAIKQQGFPEQFLRMWRYYFSYCAGAFQQNYITDIHALWLKRE